MRRPAPNVLFDRAPGSVSARHALVMLPGAGMSAEDFVTQGFVSALRERGLPVDVMAVDADIADYLQYDFCVRLHRDILVPLREDGKNRKIWLVGISLGAQAAIRCLRDYSAELDGVMLIAPFLATRGAVADVMRAGGLDGWHADMPEPGATQFDAVEKDLLAWLKTHLKQDSTLPPVCVGYGLDDRYADSARLLAARLPGNRVWCVPGGHDWPAWRALWRGMLDNFDEISGE